MSLVRLKAGLETMVQLVPSQCSTRSPEKLSRNPTAQTLFVEMAVTLFNTPPSFSFGLETTLQLVPSQCSIKGSAIPVLEMFCAPTVQTSLLATAPTPSRLARPLRVGVGMALQVVPSKCTASGVSELVSRFVVPTAQISLSAMAAVAAKDALLNCLTTWKLVEEATGTAPQ